MKLVVLGQKKIVNGKPHYMIFYNEKYDQYESKPIRKNKTIKTDVSPFPFETFSSLDLDTKFFNEYDPCYLLIETNVSPIKASFMQSGNRRSYLFPNREVTFLEEFNTPFQYALEQYLKHPVRLGTWDLTTWLIHDKTRSDDEFKAMSKILELAYKKYIKSEYYLSISFDESVIQYLPQLVDLKKVKFGDGGYFDGRPETFLKINNLTSKQLSEFMFKYIYSLDSLLEIIMKHPLLGEEWFFNELANDNSVLTRHLKESLFGSIRKPLGYSFDYHRFLDVWYNKMITQKHIDVVKFFNNQKLEDKYLDQKSKYDEYIREQEQASFEEDECDDEFDPMYDDDDYWFDEQYYDDYYNMPDFPKDKRLDVLRNFDTIFRNLISRDELKAKFKGVPDVLWDRLRE